ncbi:unnamed protein product, partial [Iphiclides podalirius]
MQQLISIDHESRTNSYRAEDEPRTSEATPLLQRFPIQTGQVGNRRQTAVVVSLLLVILLSGVIIGIYLLVVQSRSENVLPPIETAMRFVTRSQWDKITNERIDLLPQPMTSRQVIVVETNTAQCSSLQNCVELLDTMRMTNTSVLPYNFLISANGQTFEALGWRRRSTLFPDFDSTAIVLAFIGNYTEESPARAQIQQAEAFLAESLSQQRLVPGNSSPTHTVGRSAGGERASVTFSTCSQPLTSCAPDYMHAALSRRENDVLFLRVGVGVSASLFKSVTDAPLRAYVRR